MKFCKLRNNDYFYFGNSRKNTELREIRSL
nr:MAG TPA: hypothetical protein [Caudoviricetes sp.]DAY20532.1 MAG TPA: hypothetical protein [Caudoviricetes sp.]